MEAGNNPLYESRISMLNNAVSVQLRERNGDETKSNQIKHECESEEKKYY